MRDSSPPHGKWSSLVQDHGTEEIVHGSQPQKYEQNFARSLALEDALHPDVLLVWEMNGVPLPPKNGGPVRLLVPGWYGVCNAKWLNHIQIQDSRFMGRFMARDYVTLMEEKDGNQTIWEETSVSRIQLKSMVAPDAQWQQAPGHRLRAERWNAAALPGNSRR